MTNYEYKDKLFAIAHRLEVNNKRLFNEQDFDSEFVEKLEEENHLLYTQVKDYLIAEKQLLISFSIVLYDYRKEMKKIIITKEAGDE